MNRYFKYSDTPTNGDEYCCFLQLNNDNCCVRAVYQVLDRLINTSIEVEHGQFFLPEGGFDELDRLTQIHEKEFLTIWNLSMDPFRDKWGDMRSNVEIGMKLRCEIACFYPQGAILNIGLGFYGMMDYAQCESIVGRANMYPRTKLEAVVSTFDETNLWVVVKP